MLAKFLLYQETITKWR